MSEVTIKISGKDNSDTAFRQAKNNEERLAAAAKTAGIDLTIMGQKGEAAGKLTGDSADRAHAGIKRLDAGIGELNKGMSALRDEFEKTGDVDFLRQGNRLAQSRRELEKYRKELTTMLGDGAGEDTGKGFARRFLDSVSGGLSGDLGEKLQALPSTLKGALIAGVVGAGVAAAPALGAAVSLAVLGGIGAGGIVGGVALAAKDPGVAASAEALGNTVSESLTRIGISAFRQPTLNAIRDIGDEFGRQEPRIERILDGLAPHLSSLTDGLIEGIDRLGPSLERTFARSGPVIDEIGRDIPILADGIGRFLDEVSQGGPGAVQFMHDFADGTRNLLTGLGWVVKELSHLYDFIRNNPLAPLLTGSANALMDLTGSSGDAKKAMTDLEKEQQEAAQAAKTHEEAIGALGLGVNLATEDFKLLSGQIGETRTDSDALAASMVDKILGATMSLDQATLGFAESQSRLSDAIKDNGHQLDIHTEKGQANREAILAVVEANIREYDAMIAAGSSAGEAASAYDENTQALERQLRKAGFTQEAIDGLIGKYRGVPRNVDTDIAAKGLTAAIDGLANLIRQINGIDGREVDIYFRSHGSINPNTGEITNLPHRYLASGGVTPYTGAAGGGPRSNRIWVGEHGRELVDLAPGSFVHSNPDSERMAAGWGGWGGGPAGGAAGVVVSAKPGLEHAMVAWMVQMLTFEIERNPAFAATIAGAST